MQEAFDARARELCDSLLMAIEQIGSSSAIVHLEGSLASAITASLAQRVVGPDVLGLIIPCGIPPEDIEDAASIAELLGLDCEYVTLDEAYDQLVEALPGAAPKMTHCIKHHLRAAVLSYYAALRGYAILGSSTRSDWEIGLVSGPGTSGADIFPLIHVLTSELHCIAPYYKVPAQLIGKPLPPVTAQMPEKAAELNCTYEELDAFISEDFVSITEDKKASIQAALKWAARKRRLLPGQLPLHASLVKDASVAQNHEAYDRSIEALTLISKAITSDHYLEDILRLIVMVTAEVMNSSVCSLWLLDEKEGVIRLRATQSIDQEYLKDRVLKVGEGIVGKVVAENQPYVVPNVLTDPFFKEKDLARRMGLVSTLSMPMRVKDRVIGVINCHTSHPHVFSDLQVNVLTAVANQAAVAIEKTELMVQTRVIQEELEKRKLIERAKDLLMNRLSLSGEEAYRWLQKKSMNTRKSMREVAEAVLLAMEG